jgi:hypothetical protein
MATSVHNNKFIADTSTKVDSLATPQHRRTESRAPAKALGQNNGKSDNQVGKAAGNDKAKSEILAAKAIAKESQVQPHSINALPGSASRSEVGNMARSVKSATRSRMTDGGGVLLHGMMARSSSDTVAKVDTFSSMTT